MLERFIDKTTFESQEDFIKNFKIKVPENFNFGYDVVDAWAEEEPDKKALCWTNDHGEHIDFTFADLKRYTDQTASYFQSLGIGHGERYRLSCECRRYQDDRLRRRGSDNETYHRGFAGLTDRKKCRIRRAGNTGRFRGFPTGYPKRRSFRPPVSPK